LKPVQLLGMILYGQGRFQDAANSFEQAITVNDVPNLRYSLGYLYAHHLNEKQKAMEHFKAALADVSMSTELREEIEQELSQLQDYK
jgi:uncharacterized protein HemY